MPNRSSRPDLSNGIKITPIGVRNRRKNGQNRRSNPCSTANFVGVFRSNHRSKISEPYTGRKPVPRGFQRHLPCPVWSSVAPENSRRSNGVGARRCTSSPRRLNFAGQFPAIGWSKIETPPINLFLSTRATKALNQFVDRSSYPP